MTNSNKYSGILALTAAIILLVPVFMFFFVIPEAGADETIIADPDLFLSWMSESGIVRTILWWFTLLPFLIALFGLPQIHSEILGKEKLWTKISYFCAKSGFLLLIIMCMALIASEKFLAAQYVNSAAEAKETVVFSLLFSNYIISFIFDFFSFTLIGLWLLISGISAIKAGIFNRVFNIFTLLVSFTLFCFSFGYLFELTWLEDSIGVSSFLFMPVWFIWFGIILLRKNHNEQ